MPSLTDWHCKSGPGFRTSDFASNMIIAQRQVDGAKTDETRQRRIAKSVEALREGRQR